MVQFKTEILSSFTHPQVVPNLCEFHYSVEHKGRYFEFEEFGLPATINNWSPLTSIEGKRSQWVVTTVWLPTFFKVCVLQKTFFFRVQQKKETNTCLKQLEGDQMMTEFSFGVNYSCKNHI